MKILFAVCTLALVLTVRGIAVPSLDGAYESPSAFVKAVVEAKPGSDHTTFTDIFQVREVGQPEDPKTGLPVRAQKLVCDGVLWSNDAVAFVFVRAEPPTDATRSAVGVLFLLEKSSGSWLIADKLVRTQYGKYSNVSAKVTVTKAFPVVTMTEVSGGRGHSDEFHSNFTFSTNKIVELDPKP